MIKNDLTGKTFGEWEVLSLSSCGTNKTTKWLCKCKCGRTFNVPSTSLIQGTSTKCKYCGTKRNRNYPPELRFVFKGMKERCYNPNSTAYKNYGGRGITICDQWLNDSSTFYKWASAGYRKGLTIDRVDNDLGYSPDNCRWIPKSENNRNRSINYYATFNDVTKTVTEWCTDFGLSPSTVHTRIRKGMLPETALTMPINHKMARK